MNLEYILNFSDFNLSDDLLRAISDIGHTTATEIQAKAIPILTAAEVDFVGQAQTGTGKTAAFVLPLLQNLDPNSKDVQSIILSPTRELANQICDEVYKLGKYSKIKTLAIFGGTPYEKQIRGLKRDRPQIVVGTPGRVMDLIKQGILKLDKVKFFVLDEADEMLNMGFFDAVKEILTRVNKDRRMWMFSATMSRNILNLIRDEFNNPEIVKVEKKTLSNDDIEQKYYLVRRRYYMEALCRILDTDSDIYGIVFCRTRMDTRDLADELMTRGYSVDTLHGEMGQAARDAAMAKFKAKKSKLLVCTDVAARGIDVSDLTHVFNYGTTQDLESYVHRIGRTGRAGSKGTAISIIDPRDEFWVRKIERFTGKTITKSKLPTVEELKTGLVAKELEKIAPMFETIQVKGEEFMLDKTFEKFNEYFETASKEEILKTMFTWQFNKELRRLNDVGSLDDIKSDRNSRGRDRNTRGGRDARGGGRDARGGGRDARGGGRDSRGGGRDARGGGRDSRVGGRDARGGGRDGDSRRSTSGRRNGAENGNTRFFMNMGRDDGLNLSLLLNDISQQAGLSSNDIQKVDMKKQFSFFEVPKGCAEKLLNNKELKIDNKSVRLEYSN